MTRTGFAGRRLRQRIIALTIAYLLALSGILGSVSAAGAEASAAGGFGSATCHGAGGGQPSPANDRQSNALCDGSCCIGCLLLTAALPPPPAIVAGGPQSPVQQLTHAAASALVDGRLTQSHQSRAPPHRA